MRWTFGGLIGLILLAAGGCTNTQLRISTLNQGSTLADIQYQMVLRNLATFADNPSAMPWHISITGGRPRSPTPGRLTPPLSDTSPRSS